MQFALGRSLALLKYSLVVFHELLNAFSSLKELLSDLALCHHFAVFAEAIEAIHGGNCSSACVNFGIVVARAVGGALTGKGALTGSRALSSLTVFVTLLTNELKATRAKRTTSTA